MPGFLHVMRCVGRAVVKNGAGALASLVPFGSAIFEIAKDALEEYRKGQSNSEAALRAELEALAQAPAAEVRKVAEEVASVEAADQPEIRLALESYLTQIPASTRQASRRPDDPSGKTVPAGLSLKTAADLIQFLPLRPPRFKPGDRPLPGGAWVLEKLLGVGGFGEVWKARNSKLANITVALKFCLDPEAGAALLNEAENLNHLLRSGHHAGIVQLKNAYLDAEPLCLEYEFIEGDDLAGTINSHRARQGTLTLDTATRIILHLARTLGHVHKHFPPIVHRDLKPANVLVRRTKEGKSEFLITEFGIGGVAANQALEQTRQGSSNTPMLTSLQGAHTPLYASPEQKKGAPPDPRDDVHALGVIWYQLLIGDFSAEAPMGDWWKEQLRGRGVSDKLLRLLVSCFNPRGYRPANAAVLAEQIQALLAPIAAASNATVASSQNSAVYGKAVTFTATVKALPPTAGTPSGKVIFLDGTTQIGSAPLNGGTAILATSALSAGAHDVTVRYDGDAQFAASTSTPLTQNVTRTPLTVTATDARKDCGQANPDFTATYSGFVNGDCEAALNGSLRFTTTATANSPAGSYDVTPSGLTSGNYSITFVSGTLTVAPKQSFEPAMKDAIEERRTKGSCEAYFKRQGPNRIVAWHTAAQQGDPTAQWLLARCLQEGTGIQEDSQAAVSWLRRAAESGLAVAQNDFGDCYYDGQGVEEDSTEAFRLFTRAAEQSFAEAQKNLGVCYEQGAGVNKDLEEAARWYRKAAAQGWAEAMVELGGCYETGEGVEEDSAEAMRWYGKAAEQGYPNGQNLLGNCYFNGYGVEQDYLQAIGWFRKAADQELASAQANLGDCYAGGKGVKKDLGEAVKWYRLAAAQGLAEAMVDLGVCYSQGEGVEKDPVEAARWVRMAAEMGDSTGQDFLGSCYFSGYGVEQDYSQALTWFRKAAEQGLARAQVNLGNCYDRGKGAKKDRVEAVKWYRKAAEQDSDEAQFTLGYCYHHAEGVEQDDAQAELWYRKAADQGHRRAKNALKRILKAKGSPSEGDTEQDDESDADDDDEMTPEVAISATGTFNALLREAGISPSDVRLVRHADKRAEVGRTPYDLWHNNRPQFDLYQSTQDVNKRKKLTAPYWAVFLGTPDGKTMFVGLYGVKYRGTLKEDMPMPHADEVAEAGSCDAYELTLKSQLSNLIGKLFINWGPGKLAWIQYAANQDKDVTELPAKNAAE